MDRDNHNYKFEAKYEISAKISGSIESDIKNFGMELDDNCLADGGYYVSSLYFDSYDFHAYQDKAGGFLEKKKLRARIYEPYLEKSKGIWFEIKKRHGIKNTKTRLRLSREEWSEFIQNGPLALLSVEGTIGELKARNEILSELVNLSLKPKIIVRYWRRAFFNSLKNLRITFDSNLEACKKSDLEYNGFASPVSKDTMVLEVKYDYIMPFWLKEVIRIYNLKRDAFSKYGRSIETVYKYNAIAR